MPGWGWGRPRASAAAQARPLGEHVAGEEDRVLVSLRTVALADLFDLDVATTTGLVDHVGDLFALVGDRVAQDVAGVAEQGRRHAGGLLGGGGGSLLEA